MSAPTHWRSHARRRARSGGCSPCASSHPRLSNGELITVIGASVGFTAGFYIPFSIPWNHFVGGSGVASNLGQYITPMVTLQAVAFAAISSAFRAATDSLQGVNRRFRSMPIAPLTPVLARVSASVYRCCVGLTVALICGHAIGFRFHQRSPLHCRFLRIGDRDRGLAVIRRGPDRHRYQEPRRDAAVADLAYFDLRTAVRRSPTDKAVSSLDPARCPQPTDLPVRDGAARTGRGHHQDASYR